MADARRFGARDDLVALRLEFREIEMAMTIDKHVFDQSPGCWGAYRGNRKASAQSGLSDFNAQRSGEVQPQ
ncbi:hypothetical protein JDN41_01345 [Rhodomicrobium udaipurense]|uniref:Uncharacterized protein n=1 Tax=Rhodomicrobium udaipurense TaxID=1202716 RepID=A0A8I1KFZ0_9HYPH|nr:hypothetical protein [Rhodomicrobium udaipurense]MBJ7542200.1 hypothetical protein [Rhodomicrobium udaipurense]